MVISSKVSNYFCILFLLWHLHATYCSLWFFLHQLHGACLCHCVKPLEHSARHLFLCHRNRNCPFVSGRSVLCGTYNRCDLFILQLQLTGLRHCIKPLEHDRFTSKKFTKQVFPEYFLCRQSVLRRILSNHLRRGSEVRIPDFSSERFHTTLPYAASGFLSFSLAISYTFSAWHATPKNHKYNQFTHCIIVHVT